jgi:hypothetical protein
MPTSSSVLSANSNSYAPGLGRVIRDIRRKIPSAPTESNSHFPTKGPGTCFWRSVVAAGFGRFVIATSDATR